jgi:hypothetical protein
MSPGIDAALRRSLLRSAVYTIERVDPGLSFRWGHRSLGSYRWADHVVIRRPDGTGTVELGFSMTGWLGRLTSLLGGRIIRRMVDTEADSLRHRVQVEHGRPDGDANGRPD